MKKIFLLVYSLINVFLLAGQVVHLTDKQKDSVVVLHNFYRSQLGISSLVWSDYLEDKAVEWLRHYHDKPLLPRNTFGYEQNLYFLTDTNFSKAINAWAKEQVFYNGDFSDSARLYLYQHFYRIISPKFTRIGCAYTEQIEGMYVFLCFYAGGEGK